MSTNTKQSKLSKARQATARNLPSAKDSEKSAQENPKVVEEILTSDEMMEDEIKPVDEILMSGKEKNAATEEKAAVEIKDVNVKNGNNAAAEEEQIEYINLDEIDGSDSEETPPKDVDFVTSLSDRVYDEDFTEYLKSLGLKGSPDSLELEILKMPTLDVVKAETKALRESRRVLVYPVSSTDLSNSTFQKILGKESCTNFTVKCGRNRDDRAWNGCAILNFTTKTEALAATDELHQMRKSLHFEYGSSADSKFAKMQSNLPEKEWTETVLMLKNIGDSTTEKVLKQLFPDADVVIHKDLVKGHAYLLYNSSEKANEILEKYSEKKLEINGRRVILLKWRHTLPRIVPDGMLRIGERRLILRTFEDTKAKLDQAPDKDCLQDKIKYLQDMIQRDDEVRKLVGLPLLTYEQLKNVNGLRQFGEAECNMILKRLMEPFDKQIKKKKVPTASLR